jgi:hypothetical protein
MQKAFGEHMDLLCRKGLFPYAWVGGIEKLLDFGSQIESGLLTEKGIIKRYEDKTQEEIHED